MDHFLALRVPPPPARDVLLVFGESTAMIQSLARGHKGTRKYRLLRWLLETWVARDVHNPSLLVGFSKNLILEITLRR